MNPDLSVFQCPDTRSALRSRGRAVLNASGHRVAEIEDGIVRFSSTSRAEDDATLGGLRLLNDRAKVHGWEAALHAIGDGDFTRYVTSPVRRNFIDLLPLRPDSDVLEIGPGLGQFTSALAARCRFVDALEVVPEQARFTGERLRQEGVGNARVAAGGGDCRLPYHDRSFDLIVLNLVFEWCAARAGEDHQAVQERLLAEMHRVLRPRGALYLATKNRFGINYLRGQRDEHFEGMRFGSVLPRALARALHGRRPPGLLHSWSGLRAMLVRAGFTVEQSWWAVPHYRFPEALVPTNAASIAAARQAAGFAASGSRVDAIVLRHVPAGAVKHIMPGLNFLAVKAGGQP